MGEQVFEITMHDARPSVQCHKGTSWISLKTAGASLTLFLPADVAYLEALARDISSAATVTKAQLDLDEAERALYAQQKATA